MKLKQFLDHDAPVRFATLKKEKKVPSKGKVRHFIFYANRQ